MPAATTTMAVPVIQVRFVRIAFVAAMWSVGWIRHPSVNSHPTYHFHIWISACGSRNDGRWVWKNLIDCARCWMNDWKLFRSSWWVFVVCWCAMHDCGRGRLREYRSMIWLAAVVQTTIYYYIMSIHCILLPPLDQPIHEHSFSPEEIRSSIIFWSRTKDSHERKPE